jgi:micrococcal nuclease
VKLFTFEHVTVEEVKDGDTIVVMIDLGFNNFHRETIRFLDLDTPESRKIRNVSIEHVKRGKEIKAWLKDKILGKEVILKTRKLSEDDDVYGRYLGYVYLDEETCLNNLMFNLGFNKTEIETEESKKNA